MEENNNINNENRHVCFEKHCWKQCLAMVIATFLGGFLAFYFVADQTFKRMHSCPMFNPQKMEQKMFDDMHRMYKQDMRAFDKMFKKHHMPRMKELQAMKMPFFMMDSVKIRTEYNDGSFDIIVCLKPFAGDESKVNYNVAGRKLTVFGESQVKEDGYEQDVAFSQDYVLPKNADISNIKKEKDGNRLIISVPIKE